MARRGHTEEEILRVLREAESGDTVVEMIRFQAQTDFFKLPPDM